MRSSSLQLVLPAVLLAGIALGQEGPAKHPPRAVKTTDAPVTSSEARTVLTKVESIMRKVLSLPPSNTGVSIPPAAKPVSRTQVVAEFARIYKVLEPKVKLTPRATAFDPKVVKLTDAKQRANLLALIKMGAVAKIGPLSTGPSDTLTVPEFGDAVGLFISRMAYMTHQPSADWTGILKG